MPEKSISFRTHLLSNTTDLLGVLGLNCIHTARLIVGLVSKLAAYTEEGTPLAPTVYICNSIGDLIKQAGVGQRIELIKNKKTDISAPEILKLTAPLSSNNWKVYVERIGDGEKCNAGIFCGSADPAALTVEEIVLSEPDPNFPIVSISQSVTNKVAVRASNGNGIEFRFNDDPDVENAAHQDHIARLAAESATGLAGENSAYVGLIARALSDAVRSSHGTLIAVLDGDGTNIPEAFSDGTFLHPPLDLFARYQGHLDAGKTAISVGELQSVCEVLGGFVRSDGITLLSSDGKVLAFRLFVKSQAEQPSAGGARTRAFKTLEAHVGVTLRAAFFRSQDGTVESRIRPSGDAA